MLPVQYIMHVYYSCMYMYSSHSRLILVC